MLVSDHESASDEKPPGGFDKAKTPYKRLLDDESVPAEVKTRLAEQCLTLNPVKIRKDMFELLSQLKRLTVRL